MLKPELADFYWRKHEEPSNNMWGFDPLVKKIIEEYPEQSKPPSTIPSSMKPLVGKQYRRNKPQCANGKVYCILPVGELV
jgi:hypothetical protein